MSTLSVVIPSFNRAEILLKTISLLLQQSRPADQIIIVDQTDYQSTDSALAKLNQLQEQQLIAFVRRQKPSIPAAMNHGLLVASSDYVLFLDDDVEFDPEFILQHKRALESHDYPAHVGQVLQPNQSVTQIETIRQVKKCLHKDLDFPFNADQASEVENCMAGNLCVNREKAIAAGGFDENFIGAAFRFETEFCRRMIRRHGKPFYFVPEASLHHLQYQVGGTRAVANHLTSSSPAHSVGDYYFALLNGQSLECIAYFLTRIFSSVLAKFYLRKPWFIPVRLFAELRGMLMAAQLNRSGQRLIEVNVVGSQ